MPLFKGLSSKSTPKKAIDYITREDKAAYVSVRNLFEDEDYAEQFADTMQRFNKGKKFDERKYYHFKLSCARKDNVSPEQAHLYAQELAAILFPNDECVIATHTDTKTVHSHIIVNAVNPITGKKLRITESDYTKMKDEANRLGGEFGYTSTDFRKKAQNKRTTEESHIILKGGTSWKEDLREVIEEAKRSSSTQKEFISHLALYGVSVTRSKTEYSFLHPQKKKAIRGLKLGNNYTKKEIDIVIEQNRHRRSGNPARAITGDEQTKADGLGEFVTERSVGDIQRQMQQLDRQAEYAHRGLDYDSEQLRERKRLEREQAEREHIERSRRDEELASRNAQSEQSNSDGNKSGNKKNDNYSGK
ncbi:MAG: relaxase/mobilization nuclease domain-containing protein [Clostridia bacterium]|nr:relaxase/mobilization nuclease domain-containing protein [Clostridia bacterium]